MGNFSEIGIGNGDLQTRLRQGEGLGRRGTGGGEKVPQRNTVLQERRKSGGSGEEG